MSSPEDSEHTDVFSEDSQGKSSEHGMSEEEYTRVEPLKNSPLSSFTTELSKEVFEVIQNNNQVEPDDSSSEYETAYMGYQTG